MARLGYAGTALLANAAWRSPWAAGACLRRQLFVVIVLAVHAAEQQGRRQRLVAVVTAAVRHKARAAPHGGEAARHFSVNDLVGLVDVVAHAVPPPLAKSYGAKGRMER